VTALACVLSRSNPQFGQTDGIKAATVGMGFLKKIFHPHRGHRTLFLATLIQMPKPMNTKSDNIM
jgi:hypothetical protein